MTMWKILVGTIVVLVLVAGGSWYYFFAGTGGADLNVIIDHPAEVKVGESFPVSVQFSNSSEKILSDVSVSLTLPPGIAIVGESSQIHTTDRAIGDVGPGSISKEDFTLIATDNPQSVQQLAAKIQYRIASNATARFENNGSADVRVGNRLVPLSIELPEKTISGQPFNVTVKYKNNSDKMLTNLALQVSYPPNFKFAKADPDPDHGQNEWDIKTLPAGEEASFVITGAMVGPDQSSATFEGDIIATLLGQDYRITSETANLTLAPSPLSLSIEANGQSDYVTRLDDSLSYSIIYKNSSNVPLQNVTISAALSGDMYDIKSITSNGSLNSIANTITWNASNVSALSLVPPNSEGEVTFAVKMKPQFPITRLGDKNYSVTVQAKGTSPTVPSGNSGTETTSIASLTTKVQGKVELITKAYYRDASSGIVNSGPYPPRANQKTQYSVHWIVKNYATNVSGAKVSAFLKSGAKVTGTIKSNSDIKPVYNAASGEITWDIGAIAATKGIISTPLEAIFQIEETPAVNQVGQSVTLVGDSKLTATDDFVGVTLTDTNPPVTTDLPDDTSIGSLDRRVQP